jgi:hypothetical protein
MLPHFPTLRLVTGSPLGRPFGVPVVSPKGACGCVVGLVTTTYALAAACWLLAQLVLLLFDLR